VGSSFLEAKGEKIGIFPKTTAGNRTGLIKNFPADPEADMKTFVNKLFFFDSK